MNDGPTAAYARLYEEQQPRLVAYARSLTRNSWTAEDLVAEAHFRVWRRLSAGHEIDNVPAYLMTTVRHLATAAGSAVRETPRDPQVPEQAGIGAQRENDSSADPAEQVSSVDLLVRVLGQLPERRDGGRGGGRAGRRERSAARRTRCHDRRLEGPGRDRGRGDGGRDRRRALPLSRPDGLLSSPVGAATGGTGAGAAKSGGGSAGGAAAAAGADRGGRQRIRR
ncbi:sigma-70 family RNA polymerase sigma factor [Streptomyces sp. NBC_00243]|nr:sigma-70 family RNA polymerase sigma factor [Streptomyces sp. NBC_00243]WRZ20898.1 sigma-70 family RNA polymerase sigma factor [Streptomyces sp. NBC_00243]